MRHGEEGRPSLNPTSQRQWQLLLQLRQLPWQFAGCGRAAPPECKGTACVVPGKVIRPFGGFIRVVCDTGCPEKATIRTYVQGMVLSPHQLHPPEHCL